MPPRPTNDTVISSNAGGWTFLGIWRIGNDFEVSAANAGGSGGNSIALPIEAGPFDTSATGHDLTLGAQAKNGGGIIFAAAADVAEIIAIQGDISSADDSSLTAYLQARYGF